MDMVVLPHMPVKTACEQEKCVERTFVTYLPPKLSKVEESVYTDEIELEMPEINEVEIKLEKPIEQSKSKLHTEQKKVLTSRAVRRPNATKLVKREICRPPP